MHHKLVLQSHVQCCTCCCTFGPKCKRNSLDIFSLNPDEVSQSNIIQKLLLQFTTGVMRLTLITLEICTLIFSVNTHQNLQNSHSDLYYGGADLLVWFKTLFLLCLCYRNYQNFRLLFQTPGHAEDQIPDSRLALLIFRKETLLSKNGSEGLKIILYAVYFVYLD